MAEFGSDLVKLRKAAELNLRQLAGKVHYHYSTIQRADSGKTFPTLAVTAAYVEGCGGDVEVWTSRWRDVQQRITALNSGSAAAQRPGSSAITAPEMEAHAEGLARPDHITTMADLAANLRLLAGHAASRGVAIQFRREHRGVLSRLMLLGATPAELASGIHRDLEIWVSE